jgi:hypothetical protein
VTVEAVAVLDAIAVTPASVALLVGQIQAFTASGTDQYGDPFPVSPVWSATGGMIDGGGSYTAGSGAGSFQVFATEGVVSGSADVTILRSPPVAEAGGPYAGLEGTAIAVDGSGSFDADDDIVSWEWDFDADGVYDDASGALASFPASGSGVFAVALRVTDADGTSDVDAATVTVSNVAPLAEAGGPYIGDEGSSIGLDASGSFDPGNDIVGYEWDLDDDGVYDVAGVAVPFDASAPGVFTVGLRVTDADGAVATDTASVTVNDVAPAAPVGLVATAGEAEVTLDWNDNGELDLAGYRVYRALVAGGPYPEIAGLLAGSSHLDTGLVDGTSYYYVVSAEDLAGNESDVSAEVEIVPGLDPDWVGSWVMDEGAGTFVGDGSGLGNHGSIGGSAVWTAGVAGTALDFTGTDDLLLIPDDPSLDASDAITIAAWLRPSAQASRYVIKKARKGQVDGYELSLSSGGALYVRFNEASSGNALKLSSSISYPTDGSWMHVAVTFDGQTIWLYLDGVPNNSLDAPGLVIAANDLPLSIGGQDDGVRPYDGTVDEVHLYARALSALDIKSLLETNGDSDADGMPNGWELVHGFDPQNPADAAEDPDGDGVTNLAEYLNGTDPLS